MLPSSANANAGLPMIIIAWPLFVLAFIPIVHMEWLTLKDHLLDCSSKKLYWTAFNANLMSTLVGIPIAWGLMLFLQIIVGATGAYPILTPFWRYFLGATVQSAWLIPYEDQFDWMIPTALIVLLLPFFFISYALEMKMSLWLLRRESASHDDIKKAVWRANINSYGMLFVLIIAILIFSYLILD
ncbi:MAG: hypothetical protein ACRYGR_05075 [Janthinobacterium lividum]